MEKSMKKNIYIYMNHFDIHQTLTQHCKSAILPLKKQSKEETNKIHGKKYWKIL